MLNSDAARTLGEAAAAGAATTLATTHTTDTALLAAVTSSVVAVVGLFFSNRKTANSVARWKGGVDAAITHMEANVEELKGEVKHISRTVNRTAVSIAKIEGSLNG